MKIKILKIIVLVFAILMVISTLMACDNGTVQPDSDQHEQNNQGGSGNTGNQDENSNEVDQDENRKSAFEIYCERFGYNGTEEEWLLDFENGNLENLPKYTVTFNPDNNQSCLTQEVQFGKNATPPAAPVKIGYTFLGWYYVDGDYTEEWSFIEYSVTDNMTLVAKWDYATYELPIINIDTAGEAINSKETYTTMTFSIENCDGELSEVSGGIRLRGNTTMTYEKKPYRIKFDKKQSLFGLDKAKSWVLLADYLDPSALHNYTAFSLANELDGLSFTPTPHKINLYLNGEFLGLYTLCEQVQENEGRLGIEVDEIDPEWTELKQFNFLIAMDKCSKDDPSAVEGETYFYVEKYDKYFELKYPEKSQFASEEQFESFFSQLQNYILEMLDAFAKGDIEKIKSEVNVNSLVDYFIVDAVMGEQDHMMKSFNMYYTNTSINIEENKKLNFGPVWDYDWCLNTDWTGIPNKQFKLNLEIYYLDSNIHPFFRIFRYNSKRNELYNLLKIRYTYYAKDVLSNYIENLDLLADSMSESVKLNHSRWYSSLDKDLSDKNIVFLKEYLIARKAQLDELWSVNL